MQVEKQVDIYFIIIVAGVVDPHWFRCRSDTDPCRSIRIRIMVRTCGHKKFNFYMKNVHTVGTGNRYQINILTEEQKPFLKD